MGVQVERAHTHVLKDGVRTASPPPFSLPPSLPPPNHLHVQVERKTWEVEKQKYKLENQQLMERLEATNRLVVKVQNKSSS